MPYKHRAPDHWNAYRPYYPPLRPQKSRTASKPHRRNSPPDYSNPNTVPLAPRRSRTARYMTPAPSDSRDEDDKQDHDSGSTLWPASLESLMGRTTRAYDLVINYARDCPEGVRWNRDAIARVYRAGKHLHGDIRVLKHWEREAKEVRLDDGDWAVIEEDEEKVWRLCERVQRVIKETERTEEIVGWDGYEGGRGHGRKREEEERVVGGESKSGLCEMSEGDTDVASRPWGRYVDSYRPEREGGRRG